MTEAQFEIGLTNFVDWVQDAYPEFDELLFKVQPLMTGA
jgi:hypothetical protein